MSTFSYAVIESLEASQEEARKDYSALVEAVHLARAIRRLASPSVAAILDEFGLTSTAFLSDTFASSRPAQSNSGGTIAHSQEVDSILENGYRIAKRYRSKTVFQEHLLAALLEHPPMEKAMRQLGVDTQLIRARVHATLETFPQMTGEESPENHIAELKASMDAWGRRADMARERGLTELEAEARQRQAALKGKLDRLTGEN